MNEEIRADLKDIKDKLETLVVQGAVHNHLLKTHEARSLALQEEQKLQAKQIKPIEDHVKFVSTFLKWVGGVSATVTAALLVQYALRHFA